MSADGPDWSPTSGWIGIPWPQTKGATDSDTILKYFKAYSHRENRKSITTSEIGVPIISKDPISEEERSSVGIPSFRCAETSAEKYRVNVVVSGVGVINSDHKLVRDLAANGAWYGDRIVDLFTQLLETLSIPCHLIHCSPSSAHPHQHRNIFPCQNSCN